MKQSTLSDQLEINGKDNATEQSKDAKQTPRDTNHVDADRSDGSKRKVDETSDATEPTASTDERETKVAKKEFASKGDADLAVNAAPLTEEQKQADKKITGDDIEINSEATEDKEVSWHVTEKGLMYFFYRPKVRAAEDADAKSTKSLDDVQSTFMVLVPRKSDSETAPATKEVEDQRQDKREPPNPTGYRLISLGKKRLPEPEVALKAGQQPGGIGGSNSEAIWASVAEIGTDIEQVNQGMGEKRYSTRTRGDRVTPAARPAGRGHYVMSIKQTDPPSAREVRLTYHISHPSSEDFGPVQEEIGLHSSSSILMQMRNPTLGPTGPNAPTAGLPADQRAKLSKEELQETFGGDANGQGTRYARPEEPSLLDREGVELLLIKSRDQEGKGLQGLGDEQIAALQALAEQDSKNLSDDAILKELKLSGQTTEVRALSGEWI